MLHRTQRHSYRPWIVVFLCVFGVLKVVNSLGVNWGYQAAHPLPPRTIVRMLKANNITKVKLFDSDSSVIRALANSGIEVMIAIPNEVLSTLQDSASANQWVQNNVVQYLSSGTKIRYVAVGNEPYLRAYNGTFVAATYPALKNIQQALNNANVGTQVKATVPLNADILSTPGPPSESYFRKDIRSGILQIVQLLAQNSCPFTINIYPFLSLYLDKNFPVDYAFFDRHSTPVVDGQYTYYNVFDASYDSLVVALTKEGYGNMTIIIGEIGWPTDGDINANTDYAQKFNQGFINHLVNDGGTPRRTSQAIDYYLFSLIDEDMKSVAPGNFERHWGIFRYDGIPKYTLSLSGPNGKPLTAATGVQYLKRQWCVLSTNATDKSTLGNSVSYACENSDCTELGYGSSCNKYLDANGNASYAFNQYFQRQNQEIGACSFNGLGQIVTTDPSVTNCPFIIQLSYPKTLASSTKSSSSSCLNTIPWKLTTALFMALIICINAMF